MRRSRPLAMACAMAALLTPAVAGAACVQGDLTGSWQAYAMVSDGTWTRCKLAISATGLITNTTCTTTFGTAPLTKGRATLSNSAACTFTAQFTFVDTVNRVTHGTLARDKITGTGVGTGGGAAFLFSMTKL